MIDSKPCAPYATCQARRDYQRQNALKHALTPNAALCESAGREKAAASGETQCAPSDSHQQVVGESVND